MRYHRVRVRNFRGITEAEVAFPEGRLLVIEGPNEAGKSSIVEAIGLLFEFTAESNSEEVRAVRPEGRDADPEVELEFSLGGQRCRYRKVFGRRGATELEVGLPGGRQLTGREAHNEAKRLLEAGVDSGLFRALRVLQGESLTMAGDLAASASLLRALDGGAGTDPAGESLFERAQKEMQRYYTGSRRQETGELREAREKASAAAEEVERLEGRLRALEERAREIEALEPRAVELRQAIGELERRAAELAEQADAYRAAQQAAELARTEAAAATARRERLDDEVKRRETARREAERLAGEAETARARAADLQGTVDAARRALAEAEQAAGAARARLQELERGAALAASDYAHLQEELQRAQMQDRLSAYDEAAERQAAAQAFLAGCRIDAGLLDQIETAATALARTEAQLRSVTAKVEVEGPADATVYVDGQPETLAGGLLAREAAEELRIELPGGFAVTVRPSQSQGLLEQRLKEQREQLDRLLAAAGAGSVEAARELEQRRREAAREVEDASRVMRQALRDLPDRADLAARLERTRQRVAAYRAEHAARGLPATLDEARRVSEAGDRQLAAAKSALREAEQAVHTARDALARAEREAAAADERAAALERQLEQARAALAAAEAERPMAALDADLAAARGEAAQAEAKLRDAEQRLRELAGAGAEAAEVERELEAARKELRSVEDRVAEARGALRHEGEGTLQAELDASRSKLEAATVRLETVERRARAARLLAETLAKHREAARQAYGPLLGERLAALGRRVFGDDFAVELDAGLAPARRRLGGTWLHVQQLSVGAREQLAVLHRAACAAAAGDGGVPFFLDDALGWSDEGRLTEMARVLADLAREVQVVVLTCQPGRFAAANGAEVVRIDGGRTGTAGRAADGQAQGELFARGD
ncbi:AAA family ATPase [Tepidiforma sp.]|uniref:AAA family ATPase n=1 Tax=Tepidiforma sp. TaxID=2682230 RepID=UPI00263595F8|nr:AAA family ATPase [Tepidiforma sp.]MCX7618655.1 AAA family ATPase [Tepidiforma sp.]